MHHDDQWVKNRATARKLADVLKGHALVEAEDLPGLWATEHFTPYSEADNQQRFDAFVVAALSQLARRVGKLEKQLETLRQHTDASGFDEGVMSNPPDEEGIAS
jgi:hypothetical protein